MQVSKIYRPRSMPWVLRNRRCILPGLIQKRTFYRMLSVVFNKPDNDRIKEVGPNRACAEWLLRCGAHVKWQDINKWQTDYNTLPSGNLSKYKIAEVNADDAAVMDIGFSHFEGCEAVEKARFHHCAYLEDGAIEELCTRLENSLKHLEISSCGDITDEGLSTITNLKLLETLLLYDLPAVREKKRTYEKLQTSLPKCNINFKDLSD